MFLETNERGSGDAVLSIYLSFFHLCVFFFKHYVLCICLSILLVRAFASLIVCRPLTECGRVFLRKHTWFLLSRAVFLFTYINSRLTVHLVVCMCCTLRQPFKYRLCSGNKFLTIDSVASFSFCRYALSYRLPTRPLRAKFTLKLTLPSWSPLN